MKETVETGELEMKRGEDKTADRKQEIVSELERMRKQLS